MLHLLSHLLLGEVLLGRLPVNLAAHGTLDNETIVLQWLKGINLVRVVVLLSQNRVGEVLVLTEFKFKLESL